MKVLLADDHALFRESMQHLLCQLGSDVNIIEAASFDEACLLAELHSDIRLALLDFVMPCSAGVHSVSMFHKQFPNISIVVISAIESPTIINSVMECGAMGFVPKSLSGKVLLAALRLVLSGGIYIPPALLQGAQEKGQTINSWGLTKRQIEVMSCIDVPPFFSSTGL